MSNAKWLIFKHVKSIGMNQWSYNPVLLSLSFKDVKLMKLEIFIPRLSKKGVKHRINFFFFFNFSISLIIVVFSELSIHLCGDSSHQKSN